MKSAEQGVGSGGADAVIPVEGVHSDVRTVDATMA